MSAQTETVIENFLGRQTEADWSQTLADLLPAIHEVDRTATRIWFAFFPLGLAQALEQAEDPALLARKLLLQGKYYLKDQVDSSHKFLYGHRYWPEVKKAVAEYAGSLAATDSSTLTGHIREVARRVATQLKTDESLLIGITAVAFMTLQQVGSAAFKAAAPHPLATNRKHARKSPEQVLKERARDNSQGLLGFLRTTNKEWTVAFDEADKSARFKLLHGQEVASGAATDKRDWVARDARCTVGEGPIPVQCRSASCGTCWVGVLGGAEKLSDVSPRESKMMKEFGYINTDEPKPIIRLSCQAQGFGAVSIVIPPWNGVFGKFLRQQKSQPQPESAASGAGGGA